MSISKKIAVEVAAKWWTDEVRQAATRYNGDAGSPSHRGRPGHLLSVDEDTLTIFERTLAEAINDHIKDEHWREDNPIWASSLRAVGADYGPDLTLDKAFKAAGISTLLCPTKTIMWINPDKVFTNTGYEYTEGVPA